MSLTFVAAVDLMSLDNRRRRQLGEAVGKLSRALLNVLGYLAGTIFCITGLGVLIEHGVRGILPFIAWFTLGLWLFAPVRAKVSASLLRSAAVDIGSSKARVLVGVGLFMIAELLGSLSDKRPQAVANPAAVEAEARARIARMAESEAAAASRLAAMLERRDESISTLKSLMRQKKYPEAVALALELKAMKDAEVIALGREAAKEVNDARSKEVNKALAQQELLDRANRLNEKRSAAYFEGIDEMSGKPTKRAIFGSLNSVEFDFPYSGGTTAQLEFRKHPKHGRDVVMVISQGQLQCHSYSRCEVYVRIDDGQPFAISGGGPEDNSSTVVFLPWSLTSKLKNASTIKIQVPAFQNGRPIFEFDLAGLDLRRFN